jgi:adenosylcobinamide-GDP ribazoletransferase
MIARLLGAIQFLTVVAVLGKTAMPSRSAPFFPLIGACLGVIGGSVFELCRTPLGTSLAALIALSVVISLTGGLHEDGLADCADALRAGRTREKMLAIFKDSRIGTYGAIALILVISVRWQAIAHLQVNVMLALASCLSLSRSSAVVLGAITKPVGTGLGAAFSEGLTRATSVSIGVQIVLAAGLCGWRGVPMLIVSCGIVILARGYFTRRLGGVNGDCLGATCLTVESARITEGGPGNYARHG